ncbi:MAG: MarR family transcriptional regulator [Byssovorax sp.]
MTDRTQTAALEAFTRRMFTRIIVALSHTLRDEDLSVAQVAALYLLDERGRLRVGEVAEVIGRPLPQASRLVDDLVQRGLVLRVEDEQDRRARVLSLSAKGRAFIARTGEDRVQTILGAGASLPKDVAARMFQAVTGRSR